MKRIEEHLVYLLLVYFLAIQVETCFERDETYVCQYPEEFAKNDLYNWSSYHLYSHNKSRRHFLSSRNLEKIENTKEIIINIPNLKVQPKVFKSLKNVEKLSIYGGGVRGIDDNQFEGLHLEFVQLHTIGLRSIPFGKMDFSKLNFVDLRGNNISKLQKKYFNNTGLKTLFLSKNKISEVETWALSDTPQLNMVLLDENKLRSFDARDVFGENYSLRSLNLSTNSLKTVKSEAFASMHNLMYLYLQNNRITHLEKGAFDGLQKLYLLNLSGNEIQDIEPQVFPLAGLESLEILLLHLNHLIYINLATLRRVPKLKGVSLAGNPLQCTCIGEIKEWTSEKNITEICRYVNSVETGKSVCVAYETSQNPCLYDLDLNLSIRKSYESRLENYKPLTTWCDVVQEVTRINKKDGR